MNPDKLAALTFAQKMVLKYRDQLEAAGGLVSVSTDGLTVTYAGGPDGILRQLQYWERQVQKLKGNGQGVKSIDLSGGL